MTSSGVDRAQLTPNSTIESITAEYTKEMIIRQNREKSRKNLNDSFDSVSNEISNPSKSSSLEREKNTVDAIEADKRSSLEERILFRFFTCMVERNAKSFQKSKFGETSFNS